MSIYAEFFSRKDDSDSACGDRAVLHLDARVRVVQMHEWAIAWARKHGFEAYQLIQGDRLLDAAPITSKQIV